MSSGPSQRRAEATIDEQVVRATENQALGVDPVGAVDAVLEHATIELECHACDDDHDHAGSAGSSADHA